VPFVTPDVTVAMLAGLSSVALALAGVALGRPGWIKAGFAAGMSLFAVESFATAFLLGFAESPNAQVLTLQVREVARLLAPIAWIVFVGAITRHHAAPLPRVWSQGAGAGVAVALLLGAAVAAFGVTEISVVPGRFEGARLTRAAVASAAFQLVLTVGMLAGLEACLRTSRGNARARIKYIVLGLGAVFLVRFWLLSQATLFREIGSVELAIGATTLFLGNVVIAASLARSRMPESEVVVSRAVVYRSAVVGVLGAYLLAVGGLGWVLSYFQVPQHVFWVTVVVFVTAIGLAAVLLSEQARWRAKRFIALNFYRSKYDYREQWSAFTRRLSTHLTLTDLSPELLQAVADAVGSDAAMLYVEEGSSQRYHLTGVLGARGAPAALEAENPLVAALAKGQGPVVLDAPLDLAGLDLGGDALAEAFGEGSVVVPLGWRGHLTGLLVVGPERAGMPYTPEDLEFLATMGQQATGSIVTARLSEDLARTRAFDAFARVASFVIHDLKNQISSLSLLSQNAEKYFDDPEFQRDAIKTLARIVEQMQALLARLSSPRDAMLEARDQPVDLAVLVADVVTAAAFPDRIHVVRDLTPESWVLGDPEALRRVLQNLLTNAIQATPGEGTITVGVQRTDVSVVASVSDTGAGMSEEFVRESLFVPFRTTKRGGWGIGLYQVKEIVERHGGRLTVTTKEGSGSSFQVVLPTIKR
jgi:putative PEP-CTERM system histidine kinase